MTSRSKTYAWMVALALAGLGPGRAPAQEIVRLVQNLPGDSKPVLLSADEISTWTQGTERIFLLKGRVFIEHGVVHARMRGGVAWVDTDRTRRTGILHFEVYAEGDVSLEDGARSRTSAQAWLELNTRGELRLAAHDRRILQQAGSGDLLFQRARAERGQMTGASVIRRTSAVVPVSDPPPPPVPAPAVPVQGPANLPPDLLPPPAPPFESPAGPVPTPAPLPGSANPQPPAPGPLPRSPDPPPVSAVPVPGPLPGSAPGPPRPAAAPPPERQVRIFPRTLAGFQEQTIALPNGEKAIVVTGGVILTVRNPTEAVGLLDIEADRLVVWTHGDLRNVLGNARSDQGQPTRDLEFYLAGNVEIREQNGPESRKISACEVYYDAGRNVAVAYQADLEFKQPGLPDPVHLRADRLEELSPFQFRAVRAEVFSSRLPSDPGLKVYVAEATIEEKRVPKRSLFGITFLNRQTGEPETEQQRLFKGSNFFLELENLPVFYFPYIQGDANDPLGPLRDVRLNVNRIFGTTIQTTWNVYDLVGLDPVPGTKWDLDIDYLSKRGPAVGSNFDYAGNSLFGVPGKYNGLVKAYGIYDTGTDDLGGGRGPLDSHPDARGRFLWRQRWELPLDFVLQYQVSLLSDKNFLEQYFKDEFDRDVNQETYVYLRQQRDNWAWTLLVEPNVRNWVTETWWLPRVDGFLIGQTFDYPLLDRLTYNAWANAAYARLETTEKAPFPPPLPGFETDRDVNTGRFDLRQELSLPFYAGPFKLVPYVTSDLAYYTEDIDGQARGRVYEGVGLRGSLPLTRIYPDVESDLFNLNGINHKIVLGWNYYAAHSDTPYTKFPQLDRLNDDATDQALRDIKPLEPIFNPANGVAVATSPLFDPQLYAIRRLVESRVDTLETIEVFQADVFQRWQTKRGYPENQHIVDFMTLDLSGSFFPHSERDNFGENFGFLQYDYVWNVGDRTALFSSGWFEPEANGARVFNIGASFNRPDRTNFYLAYREIDPLNSQAVLGAVTYVFSPKYAGTAAFNYDYSTKPNIFSGTLAFTRMGSDLQLTLGVNYNSITNNFGVLFEIVPNIVPASHRVAGIPAFGSGLLGR